MGRRKEKLQKRPIYSNIILKFTLKVNKKTKKTAKDADAQKEEGRSCCSPDYHWTSLRSWRLCVLCVKKFGNNVRRNSFLFDGYLYCSTGAICAGGGVQGCLSEGFDIHLVEIYLRLNVIFPPVLPQGYDLLLRQGTGPFWERKLPGSWGLCNYRHTD